MSKIRKEAYSLFHDW